MSEPKWGIKRVCPSCGIKYYDFNKNPIVCPKCEFEFDPDLLLKSRKGRSIATKAEDDTVSSDIKKEEKTLQEDLSSLGDNDEILEITDETDIQDDDIDDKIKDNIDDENDDIEIIDDDLDDKDDFSIEIDDETDKSNKDNK